MCVRFNKYKLATHERVQMSVSSDDDPNRIVTGWRKLELQMGLPEDHQIPKRGARTVERKRAGSLCSLGGGILLISCASSLSMTRQFRFEFSGGTRGRGTGHRKVQVDPGLKRFARCAIRTARCSCRCSGVVPLALTPVIPRVTL